MHNGDGLRMSHTVSGVTTSYTWDLSAGLPVVLQDGTNTYVYGLDLISATGGAGVQMYFTYDGLGSTTDLTDGSGNVLATYAYDVFGSIRSQTVSGGNYWQFAGEQYDSDSGYYYLRARYYDPAAGRFVGKDPLEGHAGAPQTQNRYAYGFNNPVIFTDPSGMSAAPCAFCDLLGIPAPTFSWPPPTNPEAMQAWLNEVVDWLYNVFFPAINAALDAWHSFLNSITDIYNVIENIFESLNDLINLVEEQFNSLVDWVNENQECISFFISTLAFASTPFVGSAYGLTAVFLVGAGAGAINIGLNYAQGDENGAARGMGFLYSQGALYAMHRTFPAARTIPIARFAFGVTGIGLAASGCGSR